MEICGELPSRAVDDPELFACFCDQVVSGFLVLCSAEPVAHVGAFSFDGFLHAVEDDGELGIGDGHFGVSVMGIGEVRGFF